MSTDEAADAGGVGGAPHRRPPLGWVTIIALSSAGRYAASVWWARPAPRRLRLWHERAAQLVRERAAEARRIVTPHTMIGGLR